MANYLERVASSAGRRGALVKPPSSGPPLLPARDVSLSIDGSLATDDQFFERRDQSGPERRESSSVETVSDDTPTLNERPGADTETTTLRSDFISRGEPVAKPAVESLSSEAPFRVHVPKNERPGADAESTKLHGDVISRVEPVAKPALESLSTEAPFRVHLPKTLRPIADTRLQPSVESEQQPGAASHVPAGSGSREFRVDKEPIQVVQSSADSEVKEPVSSAAGRSPVWGSNKILVHSTPHKAEPVPPAALPVHVPPVVGSPVKQEQSRVSIGQLEVVVNNHPPVAHARPTGSTSLLNEKANLERRYLDRFRLRH